MALFLCRSSRSREKEEEGYKDDEDEGGEVAVADDEVGLERFITFPAFKHVLKVTLLSLGRQACLTDGKHL